MHLWQKFLEVESLEALPYHRLARKELIDLFTSPRRLVLEIGSSGGRTGFVQALEAASPANLQERVNHAITEAEAAWFAAAQETDKE